MKTLRLVASAAVLLALFPSAQGSAQSPAEPQGMVVFAPNAIRTFTFSRQGVTLASFEVPRGRWLRISYDDSRNDNVLPAHLLDGRSGARSAGSNVVRILDHNARFAARNRKRASGNRREHDGRGRQDAGRTISGSECHRARCRRPDHGPGLALAAVD